jgi:cysteinyl-tRNA synthetase
MSAAYLGDVFDIHGGGLDLIFPHHENEIAQSRCAHGTSTMANTWMHNGFLQVEGEKMSKSLGNFFTINELLTTERFGGRKWPGEVLRLAMLKTHYRSPIDWTASSLEEAFQNIGNWNDALSAHALSNVPGTHLIPEESLEPLADDLGFSKVMAQMHQWAKLSKAGDSPAAKKLAGTADFLGLGRSRWDKTLQEFLFKTATDDALNSRFEELIAARDSARARKDFKESDRIRDELVAMGVVLKDGKDADGKPVTTWEIAR